MLAGLERKTSWQLAEVVQDGTPDRMQRLLYRAPWDAEAARDRLQEFVIERFGDPEGIGVLDETGIPKQGTYSVGVHKQYCGALGKIETCQVATLLRYATAAAASSWTDGCFCRRRGAGPGATRQRQSARGRSFPDQA